MAGFLWYDLETFGIDPRRSRIAQFAAQRTDDQLQPTGDPVELYCRPADDLLPSPTATLLTGITPQQACRDGLPEAGFFARIVEEMARPGTCVVGYNSLRFDDEFVRHGLYRNFHDPYEREWRDGNSRWDLLDFARLAHALRPEGVEWPRRDDGTPSFRLEDLSRANGIDHGRAHDALSDVTATIALADRLRTAQPRLWDYHLRLRDKRKAAAAVDVVNQVPVLHVSGRYPASRLCAALVIPIAHHPRFDNRIIAFDLDSDPEDLLALPHDAIADRVFTPAADLPEGIQRIPLKEIHLNRSPAIVPLTHLRDTDLARLGIDIQHSLAHAERIRRNDGIAGKVRRLYADRVAVPASDVDAALYDGLLPDRDRRQFPRIRTTPPQELGRLGLQFADPRLDELLFRYRARNWPEALAPDEQRRWDDYRRTRLECDRGWSEYDFDGYFEEIRRLHAERGAVPGVLPLLDALQAWGQGIRASLADPAG